MPAEAGEPDVAVAVGDHVAVEVRERAARADDGRDELVPEERVESGVPPGSCGRTSALAAVVRRSTASLPAAQCTAMPSKSATAWRGVCLGLRASVELGPEDGLLSSEVTFSNSMFAIDTAPTLHPARV